MEMKYKVGQKIYYTGDTANHSGWFLITEATNDKWGKSYDMQEVEGELSEGRTKRGIMEIGISDKYDGTGRYRFVTEEAFKTWRNNCIKALVRR